MSDTPTSELQTIERFPSLAAMSATHRELLKRHRDQGDDPEITILVEAFILKGRATGAVLDDEDNRWVAQGLLDYWTTKVYRTGYEPPDGTLEEFDPNLAPELPDELCPYLGLDAFKEADNDVFFGRASQVEAMLKILKEQRLLAVVGPSGGGKSSLVFAGLLPKLRTGAMPSSADWRYLNRIVPGQEPLQDLARLVQPPDVNETEWVNQQAQVFLQSASHFTLLIEQANATPAVVVVDQFEEIFTLCPDEDTRMAFINNLIGLVESPNARHLVILTVRVDFQSQVVRVNRLQKLFNEGAIGVSALNASELRDTIQKPAELIGLKFEEGLVDQLVRDVLGEPAALPLLQFTLLKLWENRERNRLTWAAYHKMGGGRNALAYSADELYNSLIPEDQVTCKRILMRIVRPGEGLEVTSNRVLRTSLYRASDARDRVDRVLIRLLKSRLLRQTEGDTPDETQIEVAHEALVRNWPTLVEWLDEERSNLRNRLRLTAAAKQWKQLGKEKGALLRGVMLHIAESYDDLNELEQEYVQASRDAQESARKQKEQQRQRELEQAQELAAARQRELEQAEALTAASQRELEQAKSLAGAERQQAEIQKKNASQLRRLVTLLAIATLIAIGFGFASYNLSQQSAANANQAEVNAIQAREQAATANAASTQAVQNEKQANEASVLALDQQRTAQAASTQAVAQQITAIAERNLAAAARADAEEQANIAFSRQLAAQALSYTELSPDLSMLLSVEANRTGDTLEAKNAMLSGLQRGLSQTTVEVGDPLQSQHGYINSVAFSNDGRVLASGAEDGAIVLWDIASGTQLRLLSGHNSQVFGLNFSPDGKILASASADGTVILWDFVTGVQIFRTPQTQFAALSVAFNPAGDLLAVGRNNGRTELWTVATRELTATLEGHRDKVWSVAWSPDGKSLATGSADSTARIWDAVTKQLSKNLSGGHIRAIRSVVWTLDGKQIISASQDGTIVFWDAVNGTRVGERLDLHTDQVLSLALSRDGKTLASASADRTVILWDLANRHPIDILHDHTHWVVSVAFSNDGKLASGSIDETVTLRAVVVQQQLGEALTGGKGPVQDATIDADGNIFIAVRPTGGITTLWNFTSNATLAQPGGYPTVTVNNSGQLMALGNKDTALLFDVSQNQILPVTFAGLRVPVLALALSADTQLLASSSCDSTDVQGFCTTNIVQIWNTQSGQLVYEINTTHTDSILSMAFNLTGSLLATGSQDKTILLWETTGWSPVGLPLAGHTNTVTSLAFSPDGKTLASGSADTNLILWDLLTRQRIGQPFSGHTRPITALAFNANGASLLSGDDRGDLYLWTTSPTAWAKRACEIAKRNLTRAEWDQFMAMQIGAYRKTCDQWDEGSE